MSKNYLLTFLPPPHPPLTKQIEYSHNYKEDFYRANVPKGIAPGNCSTCLSNLSLLASYLIWFGEPSKQTSGSLPHKTCFSLFNFLTSASVTILLPFWREMNTWPKLLYVVQYINTLHSKTPVLSCVGILCGN